MKSVQEFFATCPKGFEELLKDELLSLGVDECKLTVGGVSFNAELEQGYRACLWSRLANKILLPLSVFSAKDADELYTGILSVNWTHHLKAAGTLLVDFVGTSKSINNSHFGALKVKDGIVDTFTSKGFARPSIDKIKPDLRVNVRLHKERATVSIDLSNDSLHRRGYRAQGGEAPLKENLAAALLMRANWPKIGASGGVLLDPMCGSGTFLIEGAMMLADIAPGLLRGANGFGGWLQNDSSLWNKLIDEAKERKQLGLAKALPEIRGYDAAPKAISMATENINNAGLSKLIRVSRRDLAQFALPTHKEINHGLVIVNPPYGERLSEVSAMTQLYKVLGERLRAEFQNWQVGVFTSNPDLAKSIALQSYKQYQFYNGAIPAKLFLYALDDQQKEWDRSLAERRTVSNEIAPTPTVELTDGAQMFANRLGKNRKKLASWLKREDISCYRLYDSDMPEYAVAIDIYDDWVHVQEYAAPSSVDEQKAELRLKEILSAIPGVLNLPASHIVLKQRSRKKGAEQYVKLDNRQEMLEITEGPCRLRVNLWDYLDTGLFLDHRPVRRMIREMAKDKTFLNLFCYSASATIHAAAGGARRTTSVDMSHSYISWAKQNLALNGFGEDLHRMISADCFSWLKECNQTYDLILLDPPTFSNSKKMTNTLDIQRDHVDLIQQAMRCLAPAGTLIFSNNFKQFKMDVDSLNNYVLQDISAKTLDEDFQRNQKIHHCWLIRRG